MNQGNRQLKAVSIDYTLHYVYFGYQQNTGLLWKVLRNWFIK